MSGIMAGDLVLVRTADGDERRKRALSGVVDGADFPVVWVCDPREYAAKDTEGVRSRISGRRYLREYPPGRPWPHEDVRRA